jgi:hypothetical protein
MNRPVACRLSLYLLLTLLALCGWKLPSGAQTAGDAPPSATAVHAELRDILQKPEFQPETATPPLFARELAAMRTRLQELWDRFVRWINSVFKTGGGGGFSPVNTGVVYFLIAVLIALAIWALIRIIAERRRAPRPKPVIAKPTVVQAEVDQELDPPSEWIAQANRFAEHGDYRRALRAVFMAILIHLDHAGVIKYARSRTNGDYLRLLRAANLRALVDLVGPVARDFDLHWYGGRPAHSSDYQRSLEAFHALPTFTSDRGAGKTGMPATSSQTMLDGVTAPERR